MTETISLELAKKLYEAGFEQASEYNYVRIMDARFKDREIHPYKITHKESSRSEYIIINDPRSRSSTYYEQYIPAYTWSEILWKYHKELFGDSLGDVPNPTETLLFLLQRCDITDAEDFIWNKCVYNPDNK